MSEPIPFTAPDLDAIAARVRELSGGEVNLQLSLRAEPDQITKDVMAKLKRTNIFYEVLEERSRQDEKWGEQNWPNGTGGARRDQMARLAKDQCQANAAKGTVTFLDILVEEVAEAMAESEPSRLRAELIQVVAVGLQWIEKIDRDTLRSSTAEPGGDPDGKGRTEEEGSQEGEQRPEEGGAANGEGKGSSEAQERVERTADGGGLVQPPRPGEDRGTE